MERSLSDPKALWRLAARGILSGLLYLFCPVAVAEEPVDLELLLAVDCSGSVDEAEYDLQMQGLAWALSHPRLLELIAGGRGLAVALVQWSGDREQHLALDWQRLRNAAEAEAVAARLRTARRRFSGGETSIGSAIAYSTRQFDGNGFAGLRRVIDISGDGGTGIGSTTLAIIARRAHDKAAARRARDWAVAKSLTINGLAILNDDPELDIFYRDYVIGGEGAFVMTAAGYPDFAQAMLQKLLQEIGNRPLAQLPDRTRATASSQP